MSLKKSLVAILILWTPEESPSIRRTSTALLFRALAQFMRSIDQTHVRLGEIAHVAVQYPAIEGAQTYRGMLHNTNSGEFPGSSGLWSGPGKEQN